MTPCSEAEADQKGCFPPSLHLHVRIFSIMLEEVGSTGYTGHIGCTAPRSFVPNHRIVAKKIKKKEGELNILRKLP